jgi:hypothetical protein
VGHSYPSIAAQGLPHQPTIVTQTPQGRFGDSGLQVDGASLLSFQSDEILTGIGTARQAELLERASERLALLLGKVVGGEDAFGHRRQSQFA